MKYISDYFILTKEIHFRLLSLLQFGSFTNKRKSIIHYTSFRKKKLLFNYEDIVFTVLNANYLFSFSVRIILICRLQNY